MPEPQLPASLAPPSAQDPATGGAASPAFPSPNTEEGSCGVRGHLGSSPSAQDPATGGAASPAFPWPNTEEGSCGVRGHLGSSPYAQDPATEGAASPAFPSPSAEERSFGVSGHFDSPPVMPVGEEGAFGRQLQQLRSSASPPAAWGAAAGAAGAAGSSPQAAATEEQLSWADALGEGGDDSLEEQSPSDHDGALPCWTGGTCSTLRPAGNGTASYCFYPQGEDAEALACASPPHHACSSQEVQEAGSSPALPWEENAATSFDMGGSPPAFPWEKSATPVFGGACDSATGTMCCPSPSQRGSSSPSLLSYGSPRSPPVAAGIDHNVVASAYTESSPMRASGAASPAADSFAASPAAFSTASLAASLASSPAAFPGASLAASSASSPEASRAASSHCASLTGSPLASPGIPIGYSNHPSEEEAEAGPDAVAFLHSLAPGTPTDGGVRSASATPPNSPTAVEAEQGVSPSPRQTGGRCEQLLPLHDLGGFTPPALLNLPGSFQAATGSSSNGMLTFATPAGDFGDLTPSSVVFLTADPADAGGDSSGGGGRTPSSVVAAEEAVPFLTACNSSWSGGTKPTPSSAAVAPVAEEAMPFLTACGSDTACLSTGVAAAAAGLEVVHETPPVFGGFLTAGQLHSAGGARSSAAAAAEPSVTLRLFSSPSESGVQEEEEEGEPPALRGEGASSPGMGEEAPAPQGDGISSPERREAPAQSEGIDSPGRSDLLADVNQPLQWHACDTSPPSSSPTTSNSLAFSPLKQSSVHGSSSSCGGWQTPGEAASCGEYDDPTAPCGMHLPSPLPHGGFGGTAGTWESPTPCSSPSTCR